MSTTSDIYLTPPSSSLPPSLPPSLPSSIHPSLHPSPYLYPNPNPLPPASRMWERRDTTGPAPKSQSMSAVYWEGHIVFFGGVLDGEAQNSTYFLDIGQTLV